MTEPTDRERRQGVRRLHQLLPDARARLRSGGGHASARTGLFTAQARYITQDNFLALMVTPAAKGGWDVDLHLRIVPPGVPDVIGTPVETPYATQAVAEEAALELLVIALTIERDVAAGTTKVSAPAFLFHGLTIWLQASLLERLASIAPGGPPPPAAAEYCREQIEAFTARHFPAGVTRDAMLALPRDVMVQLLSLLHMAAYVGVLRHPPREPGPPEPHGHASQTVH